VSSRVRLSHHAVNDVISFPALEWAETPNDESILLPALMTLRANERRTMTNMPGPDAFF
jgi:hypothetical protein